MDRSRRAVLTSAAAVLGAGCTWTSRWRTGERPEALVQNDSEPEEPVCEEWDDEPGDLSATIAAPPIIRPDRDPGVEVTVRNTGPGDGCFVADVRRDGDGVVVGNVAVRILPGRERTVEVPVSGRGVERFRLGEDGDAVTDETLVVPEVSPYGEERRLGGIDVAVEDLVFRGALPYDTGLTGEDATLRAPKGERFAMVRVTATGRRADACACVYGSVELVTAGGSYGPVPDASGVLRGADDRIRPDALAGRFGERFVNQRVAPDETVAGWVAFQLPAAVAEQDPLVRIGGADGAYWAPE